MKKILDILLAAMICISVLCIIFCLVLLTNPRRFDHAAITSPADSTWIMSTDGNHILWREDPAHPGSGWLYSIEANGDTVEHGAYASGGTGPAISTGWDTVKHPYRFPVLFQMIDTPRVRNDYNSTVDSLKKRIEFLQYVIIQSAPRMAFLDSNYASNYDQIKYLNGQIKLLQNQIKRQ